MPNREQRQKEKDRLAREVGIVFNVKNIDALDHGIATLGQSTTANTEVVGPLSPLQEDNKGKKIRNVLRRRLSANRPMHLQVGIDFCDLKSSLEVPYGHMYSNQAQPQVLDRARDLERT